MPYIQRDPDGNITGAFGPQQHDGQEFIGEDAAEYVAWATPTPEPTDADEVNRRATDDPVLRAIVAELAEMAGIPAATMLQRLQQRSSD